MKDLFGLEGRTIVVSGAGGGGIGTAVCEAVARVGANVVGIDIEDRALDPSEKVVVEHGVQFTRILADACDDASVRAAVAQAEAAVGDLHGLVCVVGGASLDDWQPLVRYEAKDFERIIHFNLATSWQMSRAVAQSMIDRGVQGSLVSLSSISGSAASPFHAPYGAAKAAVRQLAQSMAVEWGPYGIRVNAIAPGTIKTPRATLTDDPVRDRQAIPLGRRGLASEIAGAALFMLSDLASYVNGQTLVVDGGATTKFGHLDADGFPIFLGAAGDLRERFGTK